MQILGYPRTWKTSCFINGGCGKGVFAHTNGFGDFVLFESLGSPWAIHDCYVYRFSQPATGAIKRYEIRPDAILDYIVAAESQPEVEKVSAKQIAKDIRGVKASDHLGQPEVLVLGYV